MFRLDLPVHIIIDYLIKSHLNWRLITHCLQTFHSEINLILLLTNLNFYFSFIDILFIYWCLNDIHTLIMTSGRKIKLTLVILCLVSRLWTCVLIFANITLLKELVENSEVLLKALSAIWSACYHAKKFFTFKVGFEVKFKAKDKNKIFFSLHIILWLSMILVLLLYKWLHHD